MQISRKFQVHYKTCALFIFITRLIVLKLFSLPSGEPLLVSLINLFKIKCIGILGYPSSYSIYISGRLVKRLR